MGEMNDDASPVKRGTTIFTSEPFAYTLSSKHIIARCDNCLKKSEKLLMCNHCKYVYYCGRDCQKESWPIHKRECENLRRVSPKVVPDTARLMARVFFKLSSGGADEKGYYSNAGFRKFKDLMSHYSDIKKDIKRMEHFTSLCGVLFEYLGNTVTLNVAEVMGIYSRICINSFNILDLNMNSIGVGIYLGASVMDHSCKPNAVVVFDGTTIVVRTLVDLPSLDWSRIRISYLDLMNSNKDRREELHSYYYFWCDCEKCKEADPMAEAAACPNSSCVSPCSIEATECEKCSAKLCEDFRETFHDVTEFTTHHLEKMKAMAYLDVSKICLKKQEGILHKFNVQHVRTLETAFIAATNLECWNDAELYGKELELGYLLYYGKVHPLTGLFYLSMGKIQLHLEKPKDALETLRKASIILTITHGDKHTVMREELQPLLYQATIEATSNNDDMHNGVA